MSEQATAKCHGCGAEIYWAPLNGKRHPFNLDGTSHFGKCPDAGKFRRPKKPPVQESGDLFAGMEVEVDPTLDSGTIRFVGGGKVLGEIVNVATREPENKG